MDLVKLARIICKNDPKTANKLGLNKPRIRSSLYDWLKQAMDFMKGVLADNTMVEAFAYRGFLLEHLQGVQTKLETVETLKKRKQLASGRVQTLRVERNKALDTLLNWLKDFLFVLEYAVKDNPQQLEKVGIQVYTDAYLAQKRAKAKKAENPDSEPSDQDPVDPVPTDPTTTDPGNTDPNNSDPGTTEPAAEDPGAATENMRR